MKPVVLLLVHLSLYNAQNVDMVFIVATELHKHTIVGGMGVFAGITYLWEWMLHITLSSLLSDFTNMQFKISWTWRKVLSNMLLKLLKVLAVNYQELIQKSTGFKRVHMDAIKRNYWCRFLAGAWLFLEEAKAIAAEKKVPVEKHYTEVGHIINAFFEEFVEETLIQPTFMGIQ